jgi:TatD DNase family protein
MTSHDTHYHLDLSDSPEEMVKKIENAGIYTIAVTNAPSVFFYTQKITESCKFLKPAVGLHPELAYERKGEVEKLIPLLKTTRYVGEVGLDNLNKSPGNYETQKSVFSKILSACAEHQGKILTIHSRRADRDVISMIGNKFPGKVILHWFSGSLKELDLALSYGFYFSVNYSMTKSVNGQKIINALPLDRILIETDGPFILYKKEKASPLMCGVIADEVCRLKANARVALTPDDIQVNFKKLLS